MHLHCIFARSQRHSTTSNNIDGRGRDGTSGTEGRIGGGTTGDRVQYRDNALERGTHEAEATGHRAPSGLSPDGDDATGATGTITIDLSNGGMRHL